MSTVQFRRVDVLAPFTTAGGWHAPRQPIAGDGPLLNEAVRFHNFLDPPHVIKAAANFPELSVDALGAAIAEQHWSWHDAILEHFSTLLQPPETRKEVTEAQVIALRRETMPERMATAGKTIPGADLARMAVRCMLSDAFRDPARLSRLRTPTARNSVRMRRFEGLVPALNELWRTVRRSSVEAVLKDAFGPAIVDLWGGDLVVARADRPTSEAPEGGYAAAGLTEVGLTEKLYQEFVTSPFQRAHATRTGGDQAIPSSVGGAPFRLHLDVRAQLDVLRNEILPPNPDRYRGAFADWNANLDALESRFVSACTHADTALLAASVGLPWGVALTTVLRAYLAEVEAIVFSLSWPLECAYEGVNGYLGVALWEAVRGQRMAHLFPEGYLASRASGADPLLSALQARDLDEFFRGWQPHFPIHYRTTETLRRLAERPVLRPPKPDMYRPRLRHPVKTTYTSLDDVAAEWPAYPVTEIPGNRLNEDGLQLYTGATLTAQCHLFVASQLLRPAIAAGLPAAWNDDRTEATASTAAVALAFPDPPAAAEDPIADEEPMEGEATGVPEDDSTAQLQPALELIAASYLWGGRKPPHVTHRDGATFDLRFGPDTVGWVVPDDAADVNKALQREADKTGVGPLPSEYDDLQGLCLTRAQQSDGKPAVFLFRGMVRGLINQHLAGLLKGFAGTAPDDAERARFLKAEQALQGTPHFFTEAAAQQTHVAYVALLLSAPLQIIYSSPIAHLRAMRAIRLGLAEETDPARAQVQPRANAAWIPVEFVFFPHNHYHHWHVQYDQASGGRASESPTQRFADHLPLWADLGLDLTPLLGHLEALTVPSGAHVRLARVADEREALLSALRAYRPSPGGQETLARIYRRLSSGDPEQLNAPAAATSLSKELRGFGAKTTATLTRLMRGYQLSWNGQATSTAFEDFVESLTLMGGALPTP